MAYVRKTTDEYDILADYGFGHGYEVVCTEETYKEAKQRAREYRENDTAALDIKIKKRRVKKA